MEYHVLKQHFGGQQYFEGDKRTVEDRQQAKELIELGLIGEEPAEKSATKSAAKPQNKMAQEPENKSE